jgi:LysM repeat protein
MPENERDAAEVIRSYRRRRERMVPLFLGALAVVLLVVGLVFIVIWFTGDQPITLAFLSTDTPTPTLTNTPLPPTETPTVTNTPEATLTPTSSGPLVYVVVEGDSLYSIATAFELELDALIAANPAVENAGIIAVGQELIIPPPDAEFPTPTPFEVTIVPGTTVEYTIRVGDTLQSIAALFNSTAEAIAQRNDIEDPNTISVGLVIIVPVGIATPTPSFTPDPNTPTSSPRP